MKKLFALLLLTLGTAFAATVVTINGTACTDPCTVSISYGASSIPVPSPTPTPVTPPPVATNCTVKELLPSSSRLQFTAPGQSQAYSFIAANGGQLKTQYTTANLYITVSATACEFVNVPPKCAASGYVEPGLYYSGSDARKCILTPGATYYFNIRTAVKDATGALVETCTSAQCSYMPAIF